MYNANRLMRAKLSKLISFSVFRFDPLCKIKFLEFLIFEFFEVLFKSLSKYQQKSCKYAFEQNVVGRPYTYILVFFGSNYSWYAQ